MKKTKKGKKEIVELVEEIVEETTEEVVVTNIHPEYDPSIPENKQRHTR